MVHKSRYTCNDGIACSTVAAFEPSTLDFTLSQRFFCNTGEPTEALRTGQHFQQFHSHNSRDTFCDVGRIPSLKPNIHVARIPSLRPNIQGSLAVNNKTTSRDASANA